MRTIRGYSAEPRAVPRSGRRWTRPSAAAAMVLVSGLVAATTLISGAAAASKTAAPEVRQSSSMTQEFELFYTTASPRRAGPRELPATVWRVGYRVSAGALQANRPAAISDVPGAEDVMRVSGARLLVTATGGRLAFVSDRSRHAVARWSPFRARMVADLSSRDVWAIGRRGSLAELSATAGTEIQAHTLGGELRGINNIAFDQAGEAFYTTKTGVLGRIDLKTWTVQSSPERIAAVHALIFDRFSGDLLLTERNRIAQVDPDTLRIISTLDLGPARGCTQESTDDRGGLLVKCGDVIALIALGRSREVGGSGTTLVLRRQALGIDHVAPTFVATTAVRRRRHGCAPHHCPVTTPVFTG